MNPCSGSKAALISALESFHVCHLYFIQRVASSSVFYTLLFVISDNLAALEIVNYMRNSCPIFLSQSVQFIHSFVSDSL